MELNNANPRTNVGDLVPRASHLGVDELAAVFGGFSKSTGRNFDYTSQNGVKPPTVSPPPMVNGGEYGPRGKAGGGVRSFSPSSTPQTGLVSPEFFASVSKTPK